MYIFYAFMYFIFLIVARERGKSDPRIIYIFDQWSYLIEKIYDSIISATGHARRFLVSKTKMFDYNVN